LIVGHMYKLGLDGILCRCILEHECDMILYEGHEGIVGGHSTENEMVQENFSVGLWWSSVFEYANKY